MMTDDEIQRHMDRKIATDKQIEIALATARPNGSNNTFADGFVLALIARIRSEREQAVRECAGFVRQADGPVLDRNILADAILSLIDRSAKT